MKILILTLIPSPHLFAFHEELAKNENIELEVLYELRKSTKRDWGEYIPSCKHQVLNSKKLISMSSLVDFNLFNILKEKEADVIMIGSSLWSLNTWIARYWAIKTNTPFIIFSEPPNFNRTKINYLIKYNLGKKLFKDAIAYAGVTKKTCDLITNVYNFNKPTFVLPYLSDLSKFYSLPLKDKKNDCPTFLFLGELTFRKRLDLVITATKNFKFDYKILVVGDGELRQELADSLSNEQKEKFSFLGKVPYEKVFEYLNKSDYLILPSNHDGFGMVVVEALSAGIPVIGSSAVMSAVEFVEDDKNGWIFESGNDEDLKICMKKAIKSENYQQLSFESRNSLKEYNSQFITNKFLKFLNKIIVRKN